MLTLDFTILDFIQSHLRTGLGDAVMPLVTHLGDGGAVWIALWIWGFCSAQKHGKRELPSRRPSHWRSCAVI